MSRDGKKYYSIGEASEVVDLKEHVLRFWEKEFPQLAPQKSAKGRRKYTDHDIRIIERIKHLLYVEKFTVDGGRMQLAEEMGDELPLNVTPIEERAVKMESKPASIAERPARKESKPASIAATERRKIVSKLLEIAELLK